ncbi:hypothetical protein CEXT_562691, partial [Caerostris extrusa]
NRCRGDVFKKKDRLKSAARKPTPPPHTTAYPPTPGCRGTRLASDHHRRQSTVHEVREWSTDWHFSRAVAFTKTKAARPVLDSST